MRVKTIESISLNNAQLRCHRHRFQQMAQKYDLITVPTVRAAPVKFQPWYVLIRE